MRTASTSDRARKHRYRSLVVWGSLWEEGGGESGSVFRVSTQTDALLCVF